MDLIIGYRLLAIGYSQDETGPRTPLHVALPQDGRAAALSGRSSELTCINAEIRAHAGSEPGKSRSKRELEQSLICDSAKLCYPVSRRSAGVLLPNEAFDPAKIIGHFNGQTGKIFTQNRDSRRTRPEPVH